MILDERIVAKEMIVGISGDLCFVTYKEDDKIKQESNWSKWSENTDKPLLVENRFANGFKVVGTNVRSSRWSGNKEFVLIEHPLFNKQFEISLHRLVDIMKTNTITNGVIDCKFIMAKSGGILTEEEYKEQIETVDKEEDVANEKENYFKYNRVHASEHVVGKFYQEESGKIVLYMGSGIDEDGDKRHIYLEHLSYAKKEYKPFFTDDIGETPYVFDYRCKHWNDCDTYKLLRPYCNASTPKSKKRLALPPKNIRDINILEAYDEETLDRIVYVYSKHSVNYIYIPKINFKEELYKALGR